MAREDWGFEQRGNERWRLGVRPPTALECRNCGELCDLDDEDSAEGLFSGIPDPCVHCGGRVFLVLHVLTPGGAVV